MSDNLSSNLFDTASDSNFSWGIIPKIVNYSRGRDQPMSQPAATMRAGEAGYIAPYLMANANAGYIIHTSGFVTMVPVGADDIFIEKTKEGYVALLPEEAYVPKQIRSTEHDKPVEIVWA